MSRVKQIKKYMALILVIAIVSGVFAGCKRENNAKTEAKTQEQAYRLADMTKDEITLKYWFWQDIEISEKLKVEFEKLYPNITVELMQADLSWTCELQSMAVVGELPDCFWILGSPDVFIQNGMLFDMDLLWTYDSESQNVIKGINEFKLGYYETEAKWATPVKFYPTAAFLNLDVFIRNDEELPDMDWSWKEFEETVERMTMKDKVKDKHIFGVTEGVSVITWYPLAADKECIGEFGWNGTEYDMEKWVYGMNLEAKWVADECTPMYLDCGGEEQLEEKYGDNVWEPENIGYAAINCDYWWMWEDYYITDEWINDYKVVFVPYMMPHEEAVEDGNNIACMDMGAISAYTEHPREAYELLKFMTWGSEGWKYKLTYYPDLIETDKWMEGRKVSKNHLPITLDEDVWDGVARWHPNNESGDAYMVEMYGKEYDRSKYFEYFLKRVRESAWTCYGSAQIPGYDTWLQNIYFGNDGMQDYGYNDGLGIERAVICGNVDAKKYYEYLEEMGTLIYKRKLEEIESVFE